MSHLAQVSTSRLLAPLDSAPLDRGGGEIPTIADAQERRRFLRVHGPTPHAFTLPVPVRPPEAAAGEPRPGRDEWMCPA